MKNKKITTYADYSLYADIDSLGNLKVLIGKEAIENALKLWIASFPGESIRNPSKGGYISRWLFKSLNEETAGLIKEAIIESLDEDFYPSLVLKTLDVIPNYDKYQWQITLNAYSPELKIDINIEESMRSIT